jgi:predicted ATP-dependent endonuclease of OLD family
MKICSIHIKGYKQFQDTFIDFTDPKTGEPADKICFIGKNGTGKTTILRILNAFLLGSNRLFLHNFRSVLIKFEKNREKHLFFSYFETKTNFFFREEAEQCENWENFLNLNDFSNLFINPDSIYRDLLDYISRPLPFENDLHIYSPSESPNNPLININDVPNSSVNEALNLFNNFPVYHEISDDNIQNFWTLLIYLIKKRDEEQQIFENQPENLSKTKRELLAEFEKINPKILDKIATLWNKILDKAGLEFDVEGASNPIQLTDNLKAYIRLKGTKVNIPYSELSTGIRNFIFRVGHIFSLYFNREIENGFLLIDEPENSLFPDFLFELIETYESIVVDKNGNNNTQIFMTTHNPIIAAQFEPHERIILEWENDGTVKAFKGKTPVGDDPNDILKNDFGLESLMGKKGVNMWNEYLSLKQSLRKTNTDEEKLALIDKITIIGTAYNFD